MKLHEVKIGDTVTFKKNGKMIKGKILHRHDGTQPHLVGHVNVVADSGKSYPITIHVSKLKPALKEETQMEDNTQELSTSELVNKIADGDNIAALEIFEALMAERVSDILDAHKVALASKLFTEEESDDDQEQEYGKCKECGEKMPEGKKGSYCCDECKEKAMMKKEEVEQIDELSKKTLSSYVNKSADSKAANAMMVGNVHGRVPNVSQRPDMSPRWKKIDKRSKGIATAVSKLAKEEVEQIDELSKSTMGSYVDKAKKSAVENDSKRLSTGKTSAETASIRTSATNKFHKRTQGISTAVSKLTKEAAIEPKSGIKTAIPAEAAAKAKEDMEKHKAKKAALMAAAKKELETSKIPVKLFAPKKED